MAELRVTRRMTLGGSAALLGSLRGSNGIAQETAKDIRKSGLGQIKMEACLDGHGAVWSYSGIIYAVQPGMQPKAVLAIAGGSTSWAAPQPDGTWKLTGATMSFFRDPVSGAFLDQFDNPFTSRRVAVRPNILSGGGMVFPADGSSPHFVGKSRAGETTPGGFIAANPNRPLGRVDWIETRDTVSLITDHSFEVKVQPQLEARTIFADRHSFYDPHIKRMPARMSTSTITPWLAWMQMPDVPGHLIWHCSGEKLFDVAEMPDDYQARAGKLLEILATPPA